MKFNRILSISLMLFIAHTNYSNQVTTTVPIKKVILWGHKLHSHTHSYIHWAFHRAFEHLGYETYWFDNKDDVSKFDFSNSLFITEGQVDQKIPVREDCFYILHNCPSTKYHQLYAHGHAITLEVYTHDCLAKNVTKLDDYIYCNKASSIIYMPWATDLLPDEIDANKHSIYPKTNEAVYIGTIWKGKFGNIKQIDPFKKAAQANKVKFKHARRCSMEKNIEQVNNAYMAPAIQGSWQIEKGYIPCRIFKNISYGAFGITNSKTVYDLFHGKTIYNADTYQLFNDAKEKLDNLNVNELYELMDFVKEKHTYINRINHLLSFLETIYQNQNK